MKNRIPVFLEKKRICIICEGDEEYDYLEKLKELNVWNSQYAVKLENADGNGNIPARYQDCYQNGSFDIVMVFCDTDRKPYEQYEDIKRKIDEFHGVENASDKVVIYGNPCTMQIILKHWADVSLKSQAKNVNADLIEQLTGIRNYKGRADQRKALMEQITVENYQQMKVRTESLEWDDKIKGSSNFYQLLLCLENDDDKWIEIINEYLEQ